MAEWDNDQDFAKVQWDERDFPLGMHDHHVQKVTCVFRSQRILWPPFFCRTLEIPSGLFLFDWNPRKVLDLSVQRWCLIFSTMVTPPFRSLFREYLSIPSRSLTARPQKVAFVIGKANVFQHHFSGVNSLLNFGVVYLTFASSKGI